MYSTQQNQIHLYEEKKKEHTIEIEAKILETKRIIKENDVKIQTPEKNERRRRKKEKYRINK